MSFWLAVAACDIVPDDLEEANGAAGMDAGDSTATAGAAGSENRAGSSGGGARAGQSGGGTGGSSAGSGGARAAGSDGASAAGRGGSGGRGGAGGAGTGGASGTGGTAGETSVMMNFFVTSATSATADLGGLEGADEQCQSLAAAVGHGSKTWRAYLSAEDPETNAADRIGPGPYYNALGSMLAADKDALHARAGDASFFVTEKGQRINGQWIDSPRPNEHDILTGTQRDGTLAAGRTCGDWTSTTGESQVGHSDGLGPNQDTSGTRSYWNSAHTGMCGNTMPGGGAGRYYCFVAP